MDPATALDLLSSSTDPLVLGVRHHSPACAAAVPHWLEAFSPTRLLLELPAELAPWLEWLSAPGLVAPVALAAARGEGDIAFYPFADFSPELAAVRWCRAHGVPVEPFDLPVGQRGAIGDVEVEDHEREDPDGGGDGGSEDEQAPASLLARWLAAEDAPDPEALWDRTVEARAPGQSAEAVRRAALLHGWAIRCDAALSGRAPVRDLVRERYMRERLEAARSEGAAGGGPARIACLVGAFHGAALVDPAADPLPRLGSAGDQEGKKKAKKTKKVKEPEITTSLLPYSFELLDSRSGYPAGIRDPLWQQRVWQALRERAPIGPLTAEAIVAVCREVRAAKHVAGVPDATEAVRLAEDLARLRDLPGPGRRELLEAIESALGRGERLGRGRVVARALDRVLVGRERGRLAAGTPRSGLLPHVEGLLAALRLPGPTNRSRQAEVVRLDPLRSDLDRRRQVALYRLSACGVPYAESIEQGGADDEALTSPWAIRWTPTTEATIELAGLRGVTLKQAASGAIRARIAAMEAEERYGAERRLDVLEIAAECGLGDVVRDGLAGLMGPFLDEARLGDLVRAVVLVERIARGHVPGLPSPDDASKPGDPGAVEGFALPEDVRRSELLLAAIRALDGLAGSDRPEDALALVELVRLFERMEAADVDAIGGGRLGWALDRLAADGAPLMQGAGGAARALLGRDSPAGFGEAMGSWVDAAVDAEARRHLAARLSGALLVAGPALEGHPDWLNGMAARIEGIEDDAFLERLPALREGFDVLSPAARDRLLSVALDRLGADPRSTSLDVDPLVLGAWASADRAGRAALVRLGLDDVLAAAPSSFDGAPPARTLAATRTSAPPARPLAATGQAPAPPTAAGRAVPPPDRWRLVLGRQKEQLPPGERRFARALDELYGAGRGEGSRSDLGAGSGGGNEAPFPTVREWAEELDDLFGGEVRHEVVGVAAERGDPNAILALDPDEVVPSVELLEQVLSLKGGLSEAQLARLRRVVDRVVDALVRALAARVRPALAGLTVPRPTARPTGRLDLGRTVRKNLRTARSTDDGVTIVPERLVFRTRGRRSIDWRVVLVVDVSGSMEASVIHAAMMATILASLPAVSVDFLAFSTEVVDLTERVDDPLGLLLEVKVGGGTDIGKALRAARERIKVPTRTLLVVVSDFEEGGSVPALLAEVRALVEAGVKAIGLAALDEKAQPRFCVPVAERIVGAGMPVAALTPVELARWVGEQIR